VISRPTLPIALVALSVTVVAITYGLLNPGFGGDSGQYVVVGKNIAFNGCVSTSSPESKSCVPHWGGNQFPGYPLLVAAAIWLSDLGIETKTEDLAAYIIVLQALALGLATFHLGKVTALFSGSMRMAVGLALVAGLSPLHFAWSRWVLTETLSTALTIWLLAELLLCLHERRLRVLPLALCLSASFFVRYDSVSLWPSVVIIGFVVHRPLHAMRRGLATGLIFLLPIFGWSARNVQSGLSVMPMPDYGVGYLKGQGYYDWVATWETDLYRGAAASFPMANRKYSKIVVEEPSFASEDEKIEVRKLLAILATMDGAELPEWIDKKFAEIAAARNAENPLARWVILPLVRATNIWLSPTYSYGWNLELGEDIQRAFLDHGYVAALKATLSSPVKLGGKLLIAAVHFAVVIGFLFLAWRHVRKGTSWKWPVLAVLAYILARTYFVALLGVSDPRLSVQPLALMAILVTAMLIQFNGHQTEQTRQV
jgi:sorbitol-specific phosphotransferase system component IIC